MAGGVLCQLNPVRSALCIEAKQRGVEMGLPIPGGAGRVSVIISVGDVGERFGNWDNRGQA
jgi:hypothetical protein